MGGGSVDSPDRRRLRIAFVTACDAHDRRSISGTAFFFSRILEKYVGDVHYIHNLRPKKFSARAVIKHPFRKISFLLVIEGIRKVFWSLLGKRYQIYQSLSFSRHYGGVITSELALGDYDLIYAEKAVDGIAFVETDVPIVLQIDSTFQAITDYYPEFTNLAASSKRNGSLLEELAMKKTSLLICNSEWAASSARKHWGMPESKVRVVHVPPLLEEIPSSQQVFALREKPGDTCRLLFVGVDWVRKGGEIAFEALVELNRRGISAELLVCGCRPPKRFSHPNMKVIGYLDKNSTKERKRLADLYMKSTFLLFPTRSECAGIVNAEAAAFGLPVITSDTGGINSYVENGVNGYRLPLTAGYGEYAGIIERIWSNRHEYMALCRGARGKYETELTVESWAARVKEALSLCLSETV